MSVSFERLEYKVDQIVAVCANLRGENQALRARIVGLELEKAALTRKIEVTRERLEALMTCMPEE